jgi:hydrogenase expression/formation protein HypE
MSDEIVTLAHGAGGLQTRELIEKVFAKAFAGPRFTSDDAALLGLGTDKIALTTDGFVVSPAFFPGGDIGKLSVCGTVNDLSCMCARPRYLTCSFIIEEGFDMSSLEKIASSMAAAAREAGAEIVAGDTKVVGRGQCQGVFITTAGVGTLEGGKTGGAFVREGDAVIVTGDVGRQGCAILIARGGYGIKADIDSDCAPLWNLVKAAIDTGEEIHAVRDATRGGLATVLSEIAEQSGLCVEIDEQAVPVDEKVKGFCGLLGLDPMYMACEGRMVIFAPKNGAEKLLGAVRATKYGAGAEIIGEVTRSLAGRVTVRTALGAKRLLAPPSGELLPRIC